MNTIKTIFLGMLLSLSVASVGALTYSESSRAAANHHEGDDGEDKKGPCAEIKCEMGDKFCHGKKHECMGKVFQKKLDEAKKNGVNAAKKAKWVAKIEKKIAMKKARVAEMQTHISTLEANLKEVQALKTK